MVSLALHVDGIWSVTPCTWVIYGHFRPTFRHYPWVTSTLHMGAIEYVRTLHMGNIPSVRPTLLTKKRGKGLKIRNFGNRKQPRKRKGYLEN